MGTRSLTVIQDEGGHEICVLYRQFDGYPTEHGAKIKEFLKGFRTLDGLAGGKQIKLVNGMECLARQIIAHFKTEIGAIYLYPAGTRDCGEEFIYTIYQKCGNVILPDAIFLKLQAGAMTFFGMSGTKQSNTPVLFDGLLDEFDPQVVEKDWAQ